MRLKNYLKVFFIFGLILFQGVSAPLSHQMVTAYADETQEIKLNVNSQTIVKGKSFPIYVYNLSEEQTVSYVSSAPAIVSVDEYGIVTGNLVGTATILVTVTEGENTVALLSCDIKVGPPAISVQFSKVELTMTIGQKLTLERMVQPLNTVETAKFSSYDREIASVSAGGRITAKSEGVTYIFAQIDNGRFAVCKVYVYPEGTMLEDALAENPETLSTEVSVTESLSDSILTNTEEVDFETFIKNLNAAGKTAEDAESATGDAN